MYISFIIPVYNRPDEVRELLESLAAQPAGDFEVVIVEDGSKVPCRGEVDAYAGAFDIKYYVIPNGGPGPARNYGAERAEGEYVIFLDSDCILPPGYMEAVLEELRATDADAFGGPDRASENFSDVQKAINYSMTSFFTTGGIRGGARELDKFYPRTFNMGVRRSVFNAVGGFAPMRFGEDIDLSIRIYNGGYKVALFRTAWVYHKRRTDWRKFFKQVYNSGIARINLFKKYPESLKLVHVLPAVFTIGVFVLLVGAIFWPWCLTPLGVYALMVFVDSSIRNRNLWIGLLSIVASYVQLLGYGTGFLSAVWKRLILRRDSFASFEKTFYK
ncbi:glycosyltransferase [Alistipes sp. OttesenSCG-928-B03]|nr:glycosyltransferase [Alistipes sp. OttesenSCG-928-B03]